MAPLQYHLQKTVHNFGHPMQHIISSSREKLNFIDSELMNILEKIFKTKAYCFHKANYAMYCTYCKVPYISKKNYCLNRLSGHITI